MEGENNTNQNPEPAPAPSAPGPTPAPAQQVDNTTLMAILAYIGPLVIIPFLTSKDIPFVKFHIKQGLVLAVGEILLYVLASVIWMLWPIVGIINLGFVVLSILGIVNVVNKKEAEIPLLGQFSKHFNI